MKIQIFESSWSYRKILTPDLIDLHVSSDSKLSKVPTDVT